MMTRYEGQERRNLAECPLTAEQAGYLLSDIDHLKSQNASLQQSHNDLKIELKNTRECIRNELHELTVSVTNLKMENEIKDSYIKGSIYGAKVGTKAGIGISIIVVCGIIVAAVATVYSIVTGKLDLLTLFKW